MMNDDTRKKVASKVRLVFRYPWAATLIPLGLVLGVGGWIQHALRVVTRTGPHGKDY